jgi:hypothetical protein
MTDYTRLRTPFVNMSFTPDVPSNALSPNEYNSGGITTASASTSTAIDYVTIAIPGNAT